MMSSFWETSRKTLQFLTLPLLKLLLIPITSRQGHDLKQHQKYILVSNHVRAFDPFVICAALSFRAQTGVLPLSSMTKNVFYNAFRPLAWAYGCFPARPQQGAKYHGVEGSIKLIDKKHSLLIFPQGKCVKPGKPDVPAHTGVIRIHQARPDVPLLLCHIQYYGLRGLRHRQVFSVHFKAVPNAHYTDPNDLMEDIFAIPIPPSK